MAANARPGFANRAIQFCPRQAEASWYGDRRGARDAESATGGSRERCGPDAGQAEVRGEEIEQDQVGRRGIQWQVGPDSMQLALVIKLGRILIQTNEV